MTNDVQFSRTSALAFYSTGGSGQLLDRTVITGLHFDIKGTRTADTGQTDVLEVTVYNPAAATVRWIKDPASVVGVHMSYSGDQEDLGDQQDLPDEVFVGSPVCGAFSQDFSGSDNVVKFKLMASVALAQSMPETQYTGRREAQEILRLIAGYYRLPLSLTGTGRQFIYEDAVFGGGLEPMLQTIAADTGSIISVEQGRIVVFPLQAQGRSPVLVLSKASGLLGRVTQTDQGAWRFKTLLLGSIGPGMILDLRTRGLGGLCQVIDVGIDASNHMPNFHMDITARALEIDP